MNNAVIPPGADSTTEEPIDTYVARVDSALQQAGAPPAERVHILDNLRAQILEMLALRTTNTGITAVEVAAVISELDTPEAYAAAYVETGNSQNAPPPLTFATGGNEPSGAPTMQSAPLRWPADANVPSPRPGFSSPGRVMFTIFGIILPTAALGVELATRVCTAALLDPIPTPAHAVCVALVPLTFLIGFIGVLRQRIRRPRTLMLFTGIATGVALLYTIPFLPVMPFSFIGILYGGLGLLPYAPVAAFFCGFWLRMHLRRYANVNSSRPMPPFLFGWGVLCGIALVVACYLPAFIIYSDVRQAAHGDGKIRKAALERLHWMRAENAVLQLAYAARNRTGDVSMGPWALFWSGSAAEVPREDARLVYYRLTGKPFNSVPPPATARGFMDNENVFERNPEMRDGTVGWIDPELTLKTSRIDAIADAPTATGYVEWGMTFHNATNAQREARSQILLPPGGVVSRLTLWVNGEEREAAFAGRAEVKQAYENIVAQRRDPVLVTSAGPDRILMQCFPVPPGGDMKIRIGITHPLPLESDKAAIRLPRFLERNFDVSGDVKHSLWLEANGTLEGRLGSIVPAPGRDGHTRLVGPVSEEMLNSADRLLLGGAETKPQSFPDLREPEKYAIVQTVSETAQAVPTSLVMVVDTSITARPHMEQLIEACRELPDGIKLRLVSTSDGLPDDIEARNLSPRDLAAELALLECRGGQDNLPALRHAWQQASTLPGAAIVWVHGPQPVQLTPFDSFLQLLERGEKNMFPVYEVLLAAGPDRVVGSVERHMNIQSVSGVGAGALDELRAQFIRWRNNEPDRVLVRTRREITPGEQLTTGTRASGHVARLWAFNEAMKLFRNQSDISRALELAVKYQLVTPFTGAVVLETKAQFEQAGLEAVQPGTVPTIPEPEEWALIGVALALLAFGLWKRRRNPGAGFAV